MDKRIKLPIKEILLVIILFILVLSTITIIGPGERGVVKRFGAVTGQVFNEGLHFRIPFADNIDIMDVKTQKEEGQANAATNDLQNVKITIALNYRIDPNSVAWLRQNIGENREISFKIIDPAIQEAVKASTAKFTAEELITKRTEVREEMNKQLRSKFETLSQNSIIVIDFNIVDFEFSSRFNAAIDAKQEAEQLALKAENDLNRIKVEKEQIITQAEAKAQALSIEGAALRDNPQIKEIRWIEKWNGELPTYLGGSEGIILSLPSS